jgi:ankyrin repeat protein
MSAAAGGHADVVRELLLREANPRIRSRVGKTALDFAREYKYPDVVRLLRAAGASD